MAADSTMCNAGPLPYCPGFLIPRQSIKVSMRKKKRRGGSLAWVCESFVIGGGGPCASAVYTLAHVMATFWAAVSSGPE